MLQIMFTHEKETVKIFNVMKLTNMYVNYKRTHKLEIFKEFNN